MVAVVHRNLGHSFNPVLNGIGEVRHHLHRLSEIITLAFPLDDVLVDLARSDVVFARQSDIEVSFVVSEIEINLSPVVEDKDLPMSEIRRSAVKEDRRGNNIWMLNGTYSVGAIVPASTFM